MKVNAQAIDLITSKGWDTQRLSYALDMSEAELLAGLDGRARLDEWVWEQIEAVIGVGGGRLVRPILISEFPANGLTENGN